MYRLAALLLLFCSGLTFAQPGTFALDDLSGAELYARFCASCHGDSGRGDGPVSGALNTAVPDLTRIRERYGTFPADEITQVIDGRSLVVAHGTRYMPVWGYEFWVEEGADITAERQARELIARVVDHLRTMAPVDGAATFGRYCAPCHGAQAEGDGPVAAAIRVTMPNLRSLSQRNRGEFPAESVASYIDGRRVPQAHGERYMPVWGVVFEATQVADAEKQIAAVVDYLRELQYP